MSGKLPKVGQGRRVMIAEALGKPVDPWEMRVEIRKLGKKLCADGDRVDRILAVSRKLKISQRKARTYWDSEKTSPDPLHFARVVELLGQSLEPVKSLEKLVTESAANDFANIFDRLALIEQRISQIDPEFHSETLSALREIRGMAGDQESSENKGLGGMGSSETASSPAHRPLD